MRAALACLTCLAFAGPVQAWTFSETDICRVTHSAAEMKVDLTFDPATAVYTITVTRPAAKWADDQNFRLQFDGPRPLIIGTDRHTLSDDRRSVSVSDTGFGNVLDGIALNDSMTALAGGDAVSLSTSDAEAAITAFRACPSAPLS